MGKKTLILIRSIDELGLMVGISPVVQKSFGLRRKRLRLVPHQILLLRPISDSVVRPNSEQMILTRDLTVLTEFASTGICSA